LKKFPVSIWSIIPIVLKFKNHLIGFGRALLRGRTFRIPIVSGPGKGLWWQHSHQGVHSYWRGTYEPEMQTALARLLSPGMVFWDIGAQCGFFSLLAASQVGPKGGVYSLEPNEDNVEVIHRQKQLNRIKHWNIRQAALWTHSNDVSLELRGPLTSQITRNPAALTPLGLCTVPSVTLDGLLSAWPVPDVIKMDIEGAEEAVFKNFIASGFPEKTLILMEIHGQASREVLVEFAQITGRNWFHLDGTPLSTPKRWGQFILGQAHSNRLLPNFPE